MALPITWDGVKAVTPIAMRRLLVLALGYIIVLIILSARDCSWKKHSKDQTLLTIFGTLSALVVAAGVRTAYMRR
ncbi:hypothetical protein V7S43_006058 [Phytophthora oleae]|uniref:Uncharacterized protein n=1 Tax=Phytophthora oleae TaxID=2107226 RepID=A0ABD3FPG2_9STRA